MLWRRTTVVTFRKVLLILCTLRRHLYLYCTSAHEIQVPVWHTRMRCTGVLHTHGTWYIHTSYRCTWHTSTRYYCSTYIHFMYTRYIHVSHTWMYVPGMCGHMCTVHTYYIHTYIHVHTLQVLHTYYIHTYIHMTYMCIGQDSLVAELRRNAL